MALDPLAPAAPQDQDQERAARLRASLAAPAPAPLPPKAEDAPYSFDPLVRESALAARSEAEAALPPRPVGPDEARAARLRAVSGADRELDAQFTAWKATQSDLTPDRAIDVFHVAKATGKPPAFVAENLEELRKSVDQERLRAAIVESPALQGYMADPTRAAFVKDKLDDVGTWEWLFGKWDRVPTKRWDPLAGAYIRELRQVEPGVIAQAARGGWAESVQIPTLAAKVLSGKGTAEDLAELERLEKTYGGRTYGADSPFSKALVGPVKMAPYLVGSMLARAAGGALGAGGAVIAGAGVAGPAGVVASPFGALVGQYAGGAAFDFFENVGPLYLQLRRLKGKDGALLSDDEAKSYAVSSSLALSALSSGISGQLVKRTPWVGDLLKKQTQAGVEKAFVQLGTVEALKEGGKSYGKHVMAGAALMATIGAGNAATAALARSRHGQDADLGAVAEAAKHGALAGLQDMLLLAAWGPGREYLRQFGVLAESQGQAAHYQALAEHAAKSPSLDSADSAGGELVGQVALAQGAPRMMADPQGWDSYWNDPKNHEGGHTFDPRAIAAEVAGDGGAQYDRAKAGLEPDLAFDLARYITKFGKSKHILGLANDVKQTGQARTPRQTRAWIERIEGMRAAADGEGADERQAQLDGLHHAKFLELLAARPELGEDWASSTADVYRRAVDFMAREARLSPADLVAEFPIPIHAPEKAPAALKLVGQKVPKPAAPKAPAADLQEQLRLVHEKLDAAERAVRKLEAPPHAAAEEALARAESDLKASKDALAAELEKHGVGEHLTTKGDLAIGRARDGVVTLLAHHDPSVTPEERARDRAIADAVNPLRVTRNEARRRHTAARDALAKAKLEAAKPVAGPVAEGPRELAPELRALVLASFRGDRAAIAELAKQAGVEAPKGDLELRSSDTLVLTPQREQGERATYRAIESDELIPSHDPETFQPEARYPAGVQERPYHSDVDEQLKVIRGAQRLRPSILLSDVPEAVSGPPMVTAGERALVMGGNGRAMMIKRAMKDEGRRDAYRKALLARARSFGLDPAELEKMKAPVLVRVLEEVAHDAKPEDLVAAVRRTNESLTQALSPLARAVAKAKNLSPESIAAIGQLFEAHEGTLRELMAAKAPELAAILGRDGIVTSQNRGAWFEDGKLTAEGKDELEGMFLGRVFGSADRMEATAPGLRQKLERVAPELLRVQGINPGMDEVPTVRAAIDLVNEARVHKMTVAELMAQGGLFGDVEVPRAIVQLAEILENGKPKEIAERFKAWAKVAAFDPREVSMFAPNATQEQAREKLLERLAAAEAVVALAQRGPIVPGNRKLSQAELVRRGMRPFSTATPAEIEAATLAAEEAARAYTGEIVEIRVAPVEQGGVVLRQGGPAVPELGPVWHSSVEKAVAELPLKGGKAAPAEWLAKLRKAPGVKAEELELLGIDSLLTTEAEKWGKKAITREELGEALAARRIVVEEKVLGEKDLNPDPVAKGLEARLRGKLEGLGAGADVSVDQHGNLRFDVETGKEVRPGVPSWGTSFRLTIGDARQIRSDRKHGLGRQYDAIPDATLEAIENEGLALENLIAGEDQGIVTLRGEALLPSLDNSRWMAADMVAKVLDRDSPRVVGTRINRPAPKWLLDQARELLEAERQSAHVNAGNAPAFEVAPAATGGGWHVLDRRGGAGERGFLDSAGRGWLQEHLATPHADEAAARAAAAGREYVYRSGIRDSEIEAFKGRAEALNAAALELEGFTSEDVATIDRWEQPRPVATKYDVHTIKGHVPGSTREILLYRPRIPTIRASSPLLGEGRTGHYDSPHWPENGLNRELMAHGRVSEHVDGEGRRTLVFEEVQADLHQEGRDKGYTTDEQKRELHSDLVSARSKFRDAARRHLEELGALNQRTTEDSRINLLSRLESAAERGDPMAPEGLQALPEAAALKAANRAYSATAEAVADTPFKESWEELVVKRLLRYAAEKGFDRIALTPGSVHARRWGSELVAWDAVPAAELAETAKPTVKATVGPRVLRDVLADKLLARVSAERVGDAPLIARAYEKWARLIRETASGIDPDHALETVIRHAATGHDHDNPGRRPASGTLGEVVKRLGERFDVDVSELLEHEPAPTRALRVLVKQQHQGDADGAVGGNIEDLAVARGLVKRGQNVLVTSEAELREVIRSSISEEHWTDEKVKKAAAKLWLRMQTEDTGAHLPRSEGFDQAYDKRIRGVLEKQLRRLGATGKVEVVPLDSAAQPSTGYEGEHTLGVFRGTIGQAQATLLERVLARKAEVEAREVEIRAGKSSEELAANTRTEEEAQLNEAHAALRSALVKLENPTIVTRGILRGLGVPDGHMDAQARGAVELWGKRAGVEVGDLLADPRLKVWGVEFPESARLRVLREGMPLFQDNRGVVRFKVPGTPTAGVDFDMTLFAKADEATAAHELAHWFGMVLGQLAGRPETSEALRELYQVALAHMGYRDHGERLQVLAELDGFGKRQARVDALEKEKAGTRDPAQIARVNAEIAKVALSVEEERRLVELQGREEKLSHAFELYLAEGKAPTPDLVRVFSRYKLWMHRIYRGMEGIKETYRRSYGQELELSDDVRKLFDRVMGAEDAARLAERDAEGAAIEEAIRAIPEERDREEMQKALEAERQATRDQLLHLLTTEELKERQRFFSGEREKLEAQVGAELDQEPGYRAQAFLREGKLPEGTKLPPELVTDAGEPRLLERSELVQRYGREWVNKNLRGMTTSDPARAVPFDMVAEAFGFGSGDDLVRDLAKLPSRAEVVRARVEERLQERYGTHLLENPEALAVAALDAQHGEAAARRILTGMRILARRLNPDLDPRFRAVDVKVLERRAMDMQETRPLAEVSPARALQAERAAKQKAIELLASAAKAKDEGTRRQVAAAAFDAHEVSLFNHYLWKAAKEVRERAEKDVGFLRDFLGDKKRALLGKANNGSLERVDALLDSVELGKSSSLAEVERRRQINEASGGDPQAAAAMLAWLEEQKALNRDPFVPDRVLERLRRTTHWKELSGEELAELRESVASIHHLARLKDTLLTAKGRRERKAIINELVQRLFSTYGDHSIVVDRNTIAFKKRALRAVKRLQAGLIRPEEFFRQADGGDPNGPLTRYLWDPVSDSYNRWADLVEKVSKPVVEALERAPLEDKRRWKDTRFTVKGQPYTMEAALSVALQWGTGSNRRKMVRGWSDSQRLAKYGLQAWDGEATAHEFLRHLTEADWRFVEGIWKQLESLWPEMEQLEKRMTGLAPPKIPALAFKFTTADGKEIDVQGGYYPVVYDRRFSHAGAAGAEKTDLGSFQLFDRNAERGITPHGHLNQRIEDFARATELSLHGLQRHLSHATKDIAMREALISAYEIVTDSDFRAAVQRTAGEEVLPLLDKWIRDTANDLVIPDGGEGQWIEFNQRMRSGLTGSIFAFNAAQSLQNLTGFANVLDRVDAKYLWRGVAELMERRGLAVDEIKQLSLYMRNASKSVDREVAEGLQRALGKKGALGRTQEIAMWAFQASDSVVRFASWRGAFLQALDGKVEGVERTQEAAIRWADQTARLSLTAGATKDLPALLRSPHAKWFTLFAGWASSRLNRLLAASADAKADWRDQAYTRALRRVTRITFWFMAGALLSDLATGKGAQDDDGDGKVSGADWARWSVRRAALAPLTAVPVLGSVARAVADGKRDVSLAPVERVYSSIAQTALAAGKASSAMLAGDGEWGDELRDFGKNAAEVAGMTTGLPVSQVRATLGYWLDESRNPRDTIGAQVLGTTFGKKRRGSLAGALYGED